MYMYLYSNLCFTKEMMISLFGNTYMIYSDADAANGRFSIWLIWPPRPGSLEKQVSPISGVYF